MLTHDNLQAKLSNSNSAIGNRSGIVGISAKLVTTREDVREMQSLRYRSYLSAGYLAPDASTTFSDQYDEQPTSQSILIFHNGTAAASVRVCMFDPTIKQGPGSSIPATPIFGTEIRNYMTNVLSEFAKPRAVEITRLSRHPDYKRNIALVMTIFNLIGYLVLNFDAHAMFATVTEEHIPFYKRMGFNLICKPKRYPGLNVDTVLLGCPSTEHRGIKGMTVALPDMSSSDPNFKKLFSGEKFAVSSSNRILGDTNNYKSISLNPRP
ncbi:MAG: hypothetical protein PHI71_02240 [Acidiphilium sp.]|jgi:hypothetical protein|nr:hypothetical protein [Acidiphilium sp.]